MLATTAQVSVSTHRQAAQRLAVLVQGGAGAGPALDGRDRAGRVPDTADSDGAERLPRWAACWVLMQRGSRTFSLSLGAWGCLAIFTEHRWCRRNGRIVTAPVKDLLTSMAAHR